MGLNHHGLGPLGCKALAIALVVSLRRMNKRDGISRLLFPGETAHPCLVFPQTDMTISTLELADNHILAEGAKHLVEMLKANFTINSMVGCCPALPLGRAHMHTIKCIVIYLGVNIVFFSRICQTTTFSLSVQSALVKCCWKIYHWNHWNSQVMFIWRVSVTVSILYICIIIVLLKMSLLVLPPLLLLPHS